jgi:RNA polymerase sigma-B factor
MAVGALTDLELVTRFRSIGDRSARDELVLRHAGLARAVAARYRGRGLPFEDIAQTAQVGLIQAVDRFDPTRGIPLEAYARRTIEGEILHMFRDQGWAVRMPRGLQEMSIRVRRTGEELGQRLGKAPTAADIAEELDESLDDVLAAQAASGAYRADSLSIEERSEEGRPAPRAVASDDGGFDQVIDRWWVVEALRRLHHRERRMVLLRFQEERTQREIAEELGISQMHVSRLLHSALEAMREMRPAG